MTKDTPSPSRAGEADTHASPAGYVARPTITHGDSAPEGVPLRAITKADYPATIFAMNIIRMDSGGPSWPAEDAPQIPLCWHPFLPTIEAALNDLDGGDRSKVDLDSEMFTFCSGEEDAMQELRGRSQALGMASLFLNDFFEDWSYFALEALRTRPTEARTGGDALPRDLRAWIKDEAQDKSWVAEDALIARIDEALSHPTPADDIGEGNLDCLAKRRPGEPMFIILGRDPDAEFITRLWGQRRHDAGDPEHAKQVFALADEMAAYEGKPESAPDASAYPPAADARTPDDVVEALGEVKTNIAWAEEHYSGPEFFDVAWPEIRKSLDALNTALTASGDAREREAIALLRETHDALDPHIVHNVARGEVREKIGDFLALLDTPPAGDGGGV